MKYYLIDYENVNAAGLEGIDEITSDSRVVLFYTKNSSKIDLGVFNLLRTTAAELAVIEVHHGKQALDIQLGSYVGFLIGTEPADTEYYIVSKDKGYRNIQDFWSDRHIVLCTSLREDSEIIDEPKPARSGSRSSSRGGRSRASAKSDNASAKGGNGNAKGGNGNAKAGNAEVKPASSESKTDRDESVEKKPSEKKSSGRKGIKTKAEKNTKREKHEKVDLDTAVHPARKQEQKDEAPAASEQDAAQEAAPAKDDAPEPKAPEVNAFAEAAALAAAMAAAKSESGDESSAILRTEAKTASKGDAESGDDAEEGAKAGKKAGKKTRAKAASKDDAKAAAKDDAKAASKDDAKAAAKDEPKSGKKDEPKDDVKQKKSEIRNEVNTEIQKILSKEGFSGDIINSTASFVSKNIGKDGYKQLIYRGIIRDHGQKQGLAIYRLIKGVL